MKANIEDKLWEQVRRYNLLSEEYKKMANELTMVLTADSAE